MEFEAASSPQQSATTTRPCRRTLNVCSCSRSRLTRSLRLPDIALRALKSLSATVLGHTLEHAHVRPHVGRVFLFSPSPFLIFVFDFVSDLRTHHTSVSSRNALEAPRRKLSGTKLRRFRHGMPYMDFHAAVVGHKSRYMIGVHPLLASQESPLCMRVIAEALATRHKNCPCGRAISRDTIWKADLPWIVDHKYLLEDFQPRDDTLVDPASTVQDLYGDQVPPRKCANLVFGLDPPVERAYNHCRLSARVN